MSERKTIQEPDDAGRRSLYPQPLGLQSTPKPKGEEAKPPIRLRAESKGPQDHRSRLNRHLALRGFHAKDVPGDNNCQFHALADQLSQVGISGWSATSLRKKTVQWLHENGDRPMDDGKVGERTLLRHSVGVEDWRLYIKEMSMHGITWGDEATLLAASVLFKAEIVVISSISEDYCHVVKPPDIWQVPLRVRLYLGHYHEYHYVSTRARGSS